MILARKTTERKTCSIATLSITNPTWTGRGTNPGLRGEKLATDRLNRGIVKIIFQKYLLKFNI
jgi:hypothetical protein